MVDAVEGCHGAEVQRAGGKVPRPDEQACSADSVEDDKDESGDEVGQVYDGEKCKPDLRGRKSGL